MSEVPAIDITFVQSSAAPGGLGGVGVPLVMPAIANAVVTLTGKRVRKLPCCRTCSSRPRTKARASAGFFD